MSKKDEIPEITLISDDEDDPVIAPSTSKVNNHPPQDPQANKINLEKNRRKTAKEISNKPSNVHISDDDDICEITEIFPSKKEVTPAAPAKKSHDDVAKPVKKFSSQNSKLEEPSKAIESDDDSDMEITEISVVKTTKNDSKSGKNVCETSVTENTEEKMEVDEPTEALEGVAHNESKITTETTESTDSKAVEKRTRTKCCNYDCGVYGFDFPIASSFVKGYYSVKDIDSKVYRVCYDCLKKFEEFYESLQEIVSEKKPVLECHSMLPKKVTVVLEDSDDEVDLTKGDESLERNPLDEMIELDLNELKEVMEEVWKSTDLQAQAAMCETMLNEEENKLKLNMEDLDSEMSSLQKKLDAMRHRLYDPWTDQYQELPELDIMDEHMDTQEYQLPVATKSTTPRTPRVVAMKKVTPRNKNQADSSRGQGETADIVDLGEVDHQPKEPLPPNTMLQRPTPKVGDYVYAMKSNLFVEWLKARITDVTYDDKGDPLFRVKFIKQSAQSKTLPAKHIAYIEPAPVQLHVGTRIIALFINSNNEEDGADSKKIDQNDHYYAGIIAEELKTINKHRYLVFFDDGFTQYITPKKVHVVVGQSKNVWEDCHPDCQDFTRTYVSQFPERPMVKLQVGQVVKTEWNTRWWLARVRKVDCSLVMVHFDADRRSEWIYRGSTRLGPLFAEMAKKTERQKKGGSRLHRSFTTSSRKHNQPFVEYTRGEVEIVDDNAEERRNLNRSVAKKSTTARYVDEGLSLPLPSDRKENVGTVKVKRMKGTPPRFTAHQCNAACVGEETFKEGKKVLLNPMLIPLEHGWSRQSVPSKNSKTPVIFYVAPCGRRLRSIQETTRYLRITHSKLGIDLFSFDHMLHINTEFSVSNPLFSIKDISYDKENVVIPCVNTINHHEYPAYVEYATKRLPTQGVFINQDPGFMVCCDCTDGCLNKKDCACHQLTVEVGKVTEETRKLMQEEAARRAKRSTGERSTEAESRRDEQQRSKNAEYISKEYDPEKYGYQYRRLNGSKNSAIYECNPMCQCNETCHNRVVQHPMKVQLQLFKTEKRGWGIRCLHDIPSGTFLCIYAGQLLTEQEANEYPGSAYNAGSPEYKRWHADLRHHLRTHPNKRMRLMLLEEGKAYGDEYLAELDYIEVTERDKQDYESDIEVSDLEDEDDSDEEILTKDSEESQDGYNKKKDNDGDFTVDSSIKASLGEPSRSMQLRQRSERNKKKEEKEAKRSKEDKFRTEVSAPRASGGGVNTQSVRYQFDHTEDIYVMDAKSIGNIGRYFNHSCDPNVIVQNVFVDTHDLRYPWVAFFTSRFCRAGTELCWNYNYEIDSLPGRRLDCYCESANCKGRLL